MNEMQRVVALDCFNGADEGRLNFPQILGHLAGAGFEGYMVDYRRGAASYFLPTGEAVSFAGHRVEVAAAFDAGALRAAIEEAQAGAEGYSYAGFCAKAGAAGCALYLVSLSGQRVVYVGRTGETHTEHFPPG